MLTGISALVMERAQRSAACSKIPPAKKTVPISRVISLPPACRTRWGAIRPIQLTVPATLTTARYQQGGAGHRQKGAPHGAAAQGRRPPRPPKKAP